jgi:rod shape-determining protein MreB
MIAIQNKTTVLAYGDEAYDMYEKAPSNIKVTYPLNNGVIADIKNMEMLVKLFVTDDMKGGLKPSDYYIAIPYDITEVEKRAFIDLIRDSNVKSKKVNVVYKAIADGLGMDVDVKNSNGVLVVNVGYDTTEISVLSLGGIVLSKLIKVGGRKFDESIRSAIRKEYSLIIGSKTAESVKIDLRELEKEGKPAIVYGRDIVTGLPIEREIPTDIVNNALVENFDTILDNVKATLERTPPELAADIYKHGLYLTGGASQVCHLAQRLSNGVGLNVNLAENPLSSVALGLGKIIKDDQYKALAYSVEEDV